MFQRIVILNSQRLSQVPSNASSASQSCRSLHSSKSGFSNFYTGTGSRFPYYKQLNPKLKHGFIWSAITSSIVLWNYHSSRDAHKAVSQSSSTPSTSSKRFFPSLTSFKDSLPSLTSFKESMPRPFQPMSLFRLANCKSSQPFKQNSPAELDFFRAIRANDIASLQHMIKMKSIDVNMRHTLGWTPLQLAAIRGQVEIVELLLANGADPDAIDEFSNAHQIAHEHRLNYLNVFMVRENEFSDILSSESFLGSTALHYACLADQVDVIRCLMEHNANPLLANEMGHTALNYIEDAGSKQMQELLPLFNMYCSEYQEILRRLKLEERRKFPLEDRIRQSIVGQELAIQNVAGAIRRKENGWVDVDHPLVFLFLGSSGIGKTELAKQVAQYLHGDKANKSGKKADKKGNYRGFIRIDMSEYQQKHEVSKFIGSPPGYIGHDEGGQLTKALTDCPNAVVLFDEIEKAHPDVLTIMLQLFDEGRLTDGKGKTIECKDAIFIMTSNLASDEIADYGIQLRRESEELQKAKSSGKILNENSTKELDKVVVSRFFKDRVVRPILKRHFKRDEFLGRINEIVYFLPFSRPELHRLVLKELELWHDRALKKHKVTLSWDSNVIGVLANGYDVHYGARSIKYEVERRVVNKLAAAHENQLMLPGAHVHIVISEDDQEYQLTEKLQKDNGEVANGKLNVIESGQPEKEVDEEQFQKDMQCKIKLLIENPSASAGTGSSTFLGRFI